nr:LptF/LptG family permease [Spirochaeta isovalerica]
MVIKQFIPVFIVTMIFFILLLELFDLFANIFQYINNDVPISSILYVSYLYLPKCISFALPISLLFAISYTLGNLYANNELIAVFGSGISLYRFTLPLILIGLSLSIGAFYFDDRVVIPTYKQKNTLSMQLMGLKPSLSNTNVTIISGNGNIIYNLDYYNDESKTMSNVIVIERTDTGRFISRLDAENAKWNNESELWQFNKCRMFTINEETGDVEEQSLSTLSNPEFNEIPDTFRKVTRNIDEMPVEDASSWIASLKKAGLPFRDALTDYYERFSFALTPLIVAVISCALGGKFKKNILLMSLLSSLVLSVVYYVFQMVMSLMAKMGFLPPLAGAWIPVVVFLIVGSALFRTAKT